MRSLGKIKDIARVEGYKKKKHTCILIHKLDKKLLVFTLDVLDAGRIPVGAVTVLLIGFPDLKRRKSKMRMRKGKERGD